MARVPAGWARCAMLALSCIIYLLAGCSNGRGSVGDPAEAQEPPATQAPSSFDVRGTISGLSGSGLVLQLNGANDEAVGSNGEFEFSNTLANQTSYIVTVSQQPANPAQTCTPQNGSGVINGADVTNVAIVCSTQSFSIGGTVTSLQGSGLILRRNGEEDLPIASNGAFTFATPQASGTTYDVTIAAQPTNPTQTCTISNATGTVGSGDARSVSVSCATNAYVIGGRVAGLAGGKVVLRNSSDVVEVQADGAFTFPTRVASGGSYEVKVETPPASPPQTCSVANGKGTVATADITNVEVSCTISTFTIGGTVGGLAGSEVMLRNNGTDDLAVRADGAFTFATAVQSGRPYNVTVAAQPTGPAQECAVDPATASGVVGAANITNVQVRCVTVEFTVGGTVSGLVGSGLQLQNNGGDTLAVAANGAFTFNTSLLRGTPYAVTVAAQPANPTQECTVTSGGGTVDNADVESVQVSCITSRFPISVAVSGLQTLNLQVSNNGAEQLVIHSNGTYTFPTPIESGQSYNLTITNQPGLIFRRQTCTVDGGSTGTVGGGPITVSITCN